MGYRHINNLYKDNRIMLFKRCYALEKVHGTSSNIKWHHENQHITFFSGGEKHTNFVALFNEEKLQELFNEFFPHVDVTIYGEAYGKCQGMSATYGKELKFIAFETQIGETWLNVPKAEKVVLDLGLEFVFYKEISTDLAEINAERDADSVQAIRNGIGAGKKREGVVLRPLEEFTMNNGERIMSKHKRDEFMETKTPREVDPEALKVLAEADAIADEWITNQRLLHVLDKITEPKEIQLIPKVIAAMIEDVYREGAGEIIESKAASAAIGKKTALMYKQYLNSLIKE